MAKRKRLSPASSQPLDTSENLSEANPGNSERAAVRRSTVPIADVSADASLRAALEEMTEELTNARHDGRFVLRLPLGAVDTGYLIRDRIQIDTDDLQSLKDSLRERGQQTPIEVVELSPGHYGLISGWRRLTALHSLLSDTNDEKFATVQALVRRPENAAAAYLAMVEENEIRVGLSFYERARIAVQSAQQGVHKNTSIAVAKLFAAARPPKRSKILSFVALVEALDMHLQFPAAVPEKLGLSLVSALRTDDQFRRRLTEALRKAAPKTPEAERAVLEHIISKSREKTAIEQPKSIATEVKKSVTDVRDEIIPGVRFEQHQDRLILSGVGITPELATELREWIASRNVP